jgi:hypothetical protein
MADKGLPGNPLSPHEGYQDRVVSQFKSSVLFPGALWFCFFPPSVVDRAITFLSTVAFPIKEPQSFLGMSRQTRASSKYLILLKVQF